MLECSKRSWKSDTYGQHLSSGDVQMSPRPFSQLIMHYPNYYDISKVVGWNIGQNVIHKEIVADINATI
jgi:hypothetical protein